ncbi:hypothetical protein EDD34_2889 [Myceligenerans xiligouense]|uniref:Uncharacterized protein n=1 Tax=Myceligenerans xiligouense TaxID=253184 RepID=A0A3N4ZQY3_9MICO|nr:hypothetical protein EDD34_2889 [Myceligenerans xiligouense]
MMSQDIIPMSCDITNTFGLDRLTWCSSSDFA